MKPRQATGGQGSPAQLLASLLSSYPSDLIRKLEGRAGVKRAGSKARPTAQLAKALLDPARVAGELDSVQDADREFLGFLAWPGGSKSVAAADWWLRRRGIDRPALVIGALAEKGLLFLAEAGHDRSADGDPADPGPQVASPLAGPLWVPEPVREQLVEVFAPRPLPERAEPFVVEKAGLADVIRELFIFARFVSARSPRVLTTTRHMAREDFVALAADLGRAEQVETARRLEQVPDLLWLEAVGVEAGLAAVEGRKLVPTPAVERFFSTSVTEQCRLLLQSVVGQPRWGELETAPDIVIDRNLAGPSGYSDVPSPGARVRARRVILDVLRSAAVVGEWHSTEDLAERVMDLHPEFLIRRRPADGSGKRGSPAPEPTYRGLFRGDRRHSEPIGMLSGWRDVEGVFVARFMGISLRRAGLVDVGSGEEGGHFRVTELGAAVLGMARDAPADIVGEAAPGRFFLQPNFEIIADGGGDSIGAIWRLSRVAELVSFDRAALLKVTRESICRALDAGMTADEIMGALSDGGKLDMPQNVSFSVAEWIDAYQRYTIWTGVWLIETDRPDELDELEREFSECIERIGPTAARVRPDRRREVEGALGERDDVVEIDHSRGVEAAFSLDDQMNITPDPAKWHWYLDHMIKEIAEPAKSRRRAPQFRLTKESVQRALDSGLAAEDIRSFVECGADQPLSATQAFLLQGWLGLHEPVELGSVTLLKIAPQAVADFVAVPEVREAIVGGLGSGVFVVQSKAAGKLARILDKAGIAVERELRATPLKSGAGEGAQPAAPVAGPRRWGRRRWKVGDPEGDRSAVLEAAIAAGRRVLVEYRSVVRDEPNKELVLSPQSLEESRWGQKRLHAYCHWRKAYRTFDVSRMDEIVTLDEAASFPPADEAEPSE